MSYTSYASAVLQDTPYHYYRLDSISGDDPAVPGTPDQEPLTVDPQVIRNLPGLFPGGDGKCVSLDSNVGGQLYVYQPGWFEDTLSLGVEFLLRIDVLITGYDPIAEIGGWSLPLIYLDPTTRQLVLSYEPHSLYSTTSLTLGTAYHVCWTFNNATGLLSLFINGVKENSVVTSIPAMNTPGTFFPQPNTGKFSVDEVAIYTTFLPDARVAVHAQEWSAGSSNIFNETRSDAVNSSGSQVSKLSQNATRDGALVVGSSQGTFLFGGSQVSAGIDLNQSLVGLFIGSSVNADIFNIDTASIPKNRTYPISIDIVTSQDIQSLQQNLREQVSSSFETLPVSENIATLFEQREDSVFAIDELLAQCNKNIALLDLAFSVGDSASSANLIPEILSELVVVHQLTLDNSLSLKESFVESFSLNQDLTGSTTLFSSISEVFAYQALLIKFAITTLSSIASTVSFGESTLTILKGYQDLLNSLNVIADVTTPFWAMISSIQEALSFSSTQEERVSSLGSIAEIITILETYQKEQVSVFSLAQENLIAAEIEQTSLLSFEERSDLALLSENVYVNLMGVLEGIQESIVLLEQALSRTSLLTLVQSSASLFDAVPPTFSVLLEELRDEAQVLLSSTGDVSFSGSVESILSISESVNLAILEIYDNQIDSFSLLATSYSKAEINNERLEILSWLEEASLMISSGIAEVQDNLVAGSSQETRTETLRSIFSSLLFQDQFWLMAISTSPILSEFFVANSSENTRSIVANFLSETANLSDTLPYSPGFFNLLVSSFSAEEIASVPLTYKESVLNSNPTNYWKLDSVVGTTLINEISTGVSGEAVGSPLLGEAGLSSYPGARSISLGTVIGARKYTNHTISASLAEGSSIEFFFKQEAESGTEAILFETEEKRLGLAGQTLRYYCLGEMQLEVLSPLITLGTVYHTVHTFSENNIHSIYLNGVLVARLSGANMSAIINKIVLNATRGPLSTDDSSTGVLVGWHWFDQALNQEFICTSNAVGNAVWKRTDGIDAIRYGVQSLSVGEKAQVKANLGFPDVIGDMLKATYDSDDSGSVDNSELLGGNAGSYYLNRGNHLGTQSLSSLAQSGADVDQVPKWSGTSWVPGNVSSGAGSPTGMISGFPTLSFPSGWLPCNGQNVSRTTESALFSAIGTNYGIGDGSTTFALPGPHSPIYEYTSATSFPFIMQQHTITTLPDGRVLVTGGYSGSIQTGCFLGTVTGRNISWVSATSLPEGRYAHTAVLLDDGRVLISGGMAPTGLTASCLIGTITGNTISWIATDSLPIAMQASGAVNIGGNRVLVAGGLTTIDRQETYIGTVSGDAILWVAGTLLPGTRSYHTVTALSPNKILVLGGASSGVVQSTSYVGNIVGDTISWVTGSFPIQIRLHAATLRHDGRVEVSGGDNGGILSSRYIGTLINDVMVWVQLSPLPSTRHTHALCTLLNGRALSVGGSTYGGSLTLTSWIDSVDFMGIKQ